MRSFDRMRRALLWLSLLLGGLAAALGIAKWMEARSARHEAVRIAAEARHEAVRIAAEEYRRHFGGPPAAFRPLKRGDRAWAIARWKSARQHYLVEFGSEVIAEDTRRELRPGEQVEGLKTVVYFSVTKDGRCEYSGLTQGGPY